MRKIPVLILLLAFSSSAYTQLTKEALFIGNSYTGVNNLPQMVADIALSLGDTLIHDNNAPGGYTFELHNTNATTLAKIAQQPWDFVVLQEQSQLPSFPPGQVASEVYPFADSLVRKIRENDSCTQPIFYMTWGRKNGDASNCGFYPVVCTYEGMQGRLRTSYLYMANTHDAEVSPVGSSFWRTRMDQPGIELYAADESHPSLAGSYLAACNFYSVMFRKSCMGAGIPAGLDSTQAMQLQTISDLVLWDSLSLWNIDTTTLLAGFTWVNPSNGDVNFTSTDQGADLWQWDFGDGSFSSSQNPSHTFANSGTYIVTQTVWRGCESTTSTDTLNVVIVATQEMVSSFVRLWPNPAEDRIVIEGASAETRFCVRDLRGVRLLEGKINSNGELDLSTLSNGWYFLSLQSSGNEMPVWHSFQIHKP